LRYLAGALLVILSHYSFGQIPNDTKATAEVLTNLNHWCSTAEAYTNEDASGSENTDCDPSVYNTAWFKFTATTDYLNFKLTPVGLNNNNVVISLKDENDNDITCSEDGVYNSNTGVDEYFLETENLTIGSDYYIIVANGSSSSSYEGTFGICISNKPSFDFKEGALEISNLNNWCSDAGAFSNIDATGNFYPNCGNTVYNDVWFTFIAQHDEARIVMTPETLNRSYGSVILMDENDNAIECQQNSDYVGGGIYEFSIDAVNLTVGDRYYILVGGRSSSDTREGTFSLCVNNAPNFDFIENAIELTNLDNWCSEAGAYNNIDATGNESTSCDGSVYNTVWFKVTATTNYLKFILTPETYNDNNGIISLMDGNQNTLVCTEDVVSNPTTGNDEFVIESENLTVGDTYYILVGTQSSSDSYEGTFGICVSDKPSFDFKEGAVELTDLDNWCSGVGAYTNVEAIGSTNRNCTGTVYNDVWFKFLAQHDEAQIKMMPETMSYYNGSLVLLDESENVLYCDESYTYNNGAYEYVIDAENLNAGSSYYIVVGVQYSSSSYNGSFGLCVNNVPNYDFKEDAKELTDLNNWCSGPGAYTNEGATGSESTSCDGSVYNTVWYKFTAATAYLNFKLIPETLNDGLVVLSLEDEAGNSVACINNGVYNSTTGVAEYTLETEGLTIGNLYYIKIANTYSSDSYEGTFGICVNDQASFDKKIGAVELTDLNSWCSAAGAYTNEGATGNESASCDGSIYNTVWFKFTAATSFINFKLIPQTLNDNYVVLSLEDDGGNSVACVNNGVHNSLTGVEEYTLESESLTIGATYYIKMANSYSSDSYEGTFGVCVNDQATFDRKVGAVALTDLNNWCSASAAFTNVGATGSESTDCDGSVHNSVWFKFTAATGFLNFRLKAEGINDNYVVVALQDENANPIACTDDGINSGSGGDEYVLESGNLSIGTDYYIMVANTSSSSSYEGSFSICATDQLTNDFIAGATELTNLNNYCSDAQSYSNVGAGGFEDGGCGDAYNTVWFKFTAATEYLNVEVVRTTLGTGTIMMSLIESQSQNILMCIDDPDYNPDTNLYGYWIESNNLEIGNDYYIMVGNVSPSDTEEGTFGICINDQEALSGTPPVPVIIGISEDACGYATITREEPPAGQEWYWQGTNSAGTSTSNSNLTYAPPASGTYYLRSRYNHSGTWGESLPITVQFGGVANTSPSMPTVSGNTCGAKTLTRSTPPSGEIWYWQTSSGGTSTANSNSTYSVTSSGTVYLRARNSAGCWSGSRSIAVTVNKIPLAPPTPTVSSNTCGPKTLTRGTPLAGEIWYWQTSASGTATENSSATHSVAASTTVYLRSRSSAGCWGSSVSVAVTVNPTPATPATPTVSTNTCGPKVLTRGTPPSGVVWYWQTRASGTSTANANSTYSATVSGKVYLRSRTSAGCWGGSSSVNVTVNQIPDTPTLSVSEQGYDYTLLERGTPSSGETWYWQGTNANGTSQSNSAATYQALTSGTYYIRSKNNTAACWGASASIELQAAAPVASISSMRENSVTLSWEAVPNATGYEISRSLTIDDDYAIIGTVNGLTLEYRDTGIESHTTYYYRVQSLVGAQKSVGSPAVLVKTFTGNDELEHQPQYNGNISAIR
ncbi:fibronectin type III domain-containing protein, partial [Fulvivirga lutimaris]|uniref:fibronectin type III domain-containing protein n=1 Tax=Fulvivirga lutimaris TaxID=1819566 RepID=UPI001629C169